MKNKPAIKKPAVKMARSIVVKNSIPLENTFALNEKKDIIEKIKKPKKPNNKQFKEVPESYYKIVLPCCKTILSKKEYLKSSFIDDDQCFICKAPWNYEENKETYGYSLKMILDNLPGNVLIEDVYIFTGYYEDGPEYSNSPINLSFAKTPNIDKEMAQYEKDLLAYETYRLKEASAKLDQEKKKLEEKLKKLNN